VSGFWWDEATTILIPGSPGSVEGLSSNLKSTGASIATQAVRLRNLNASVWKGEAAAKFAEHVKRTPGELDLLAKRYDGVAGALRGYAGALRDSQTKVTTAKAKAVEAHASQVSASAAVRDAQANNVLAQRSADSLNRANPTGPPVTPSLTDLGPLGTRAGDADAAMREAERLRLEAEHDRDAAAGGCKRTIKGCIQDDLKDQGGFWGWVKHTFKKIAPILAMVAAVVGIVALFIPGLNLLALGLAVACLVVDSANYFAFHQGELTTVLLDVVGVAAFAGAVKGVRAVRVAEEAEATANATRAAKTGQSIGRASTKSLQGMARTQLGMSRGEIKAAKAAGTLRQVVGARSATNVARTGEQLTKAGSELTEASRPFRTMLRDTGELVTRPGSQLRDVRPAVAEQLQLARSGVPGALYGGSLVAGSGAVVKNGLTAHSEFQGPALVGIDRAMADVKVTAKAPMAR